MLNTRNIKTKSWEKESSRFYLESPELVGLTHQFKGETVRLFHELRLHPDIESI